MSANEEMEAAVNETVNTVWDICVQICNTALHQAEVYGVGLSHIPEPNIEQFASLLNTAIIPILERLLDNGNYGAESGIKLANMKQYYAHIKKMAKCITAEDVPGFEAAAAALRKEAILP